jgi:hypothetical protein
MTNDQMTSERGGFCFHPFAAVQPVHNTAGVINTNHNSHTGVRVI